MNKEKKPLYEVLINDIVDIEENQQGMKYLSTVLHPAMESDFIFLSEDNIDLFKFRVQNKERKIIMGAVAIPDLKIYRRRGDFEFEIFFSKETIEKMAKRFFKDELQKKFDIEHSIDVEGLCVFESWIVEDTKKDKSNLYGFKVPVGTWMVSVDCSANPEYFEEFIKSGKVKGFSLEGMFDLVERFSIQQPECSDKCHHEEDEFAATSLKAILSTYDYNKRLEADNYVELAESYRWELWVVKDKNGCPICQYYADLGWQTAGVLPPINRAHQNAMMGYEWKAPNSSCRCSKKITPEKNLYIRNGKLVVKSNLYVRTISNQ